MEAARDGDQILLLRGIHNGMGCARSMTSSCHITPSKATEDLGIIVVCACRSCLRYTRVRCSATGWS